MAIPLWMYPLFVGSLVYCCTASCGKIDTDALVISWSMSRPLWVAPCVPPYLHSHYFFFALHWAVDTPWLPSPFFRPCLHFAFIILPIDISLTSCVFIKVWAPVLAMLGSHGVHIVSSLDDLQVQDCFVQSLTVNVLDLQLIEVYAWSNLPPKLPGMVLVFSSSRTNAVPLLSRHFKG